MPRYFFHIRKGDDLIGDPEGIKVAETESLEEEAVEAARDLLADGDLQGQDRRDWVFEVADETGTTVLTLPLSEVAEADFPVAAEAQKRLPAYQPCPRCSGTGTECEAVSALSEGTLANLTASNARFSNQGSRVDMQCTLCSGSGTVTATVGDNIAWAKKRREEHSAAGRRSWSPERRKERASLLRLVRASDRS